MTLYQVVEVLECEEVEDAKYSSNWIITKMHRTDVYLNIGDDPKELCKQLKSLKFIDSADMRKVSVSDMDKDIIDIRGKKDLKPLCRLEVARWMVH